MFCEADIKLVQKNRPDLDEDQCAEVIGFLLDMNAVSPIKIENQEKLFYEASTYVYPEVKDGE